MKSKGNPIQIIGNIRKVIGNHRSPREILGGNPEPRSLRSAGEAGPRQAALGVWAQTLWRLGTAEVANCGSPRELGIIKNY